MHIIYALKHDHVGAQPYVVMPQCIYNMSVEGVIHLTSVITKMISEISIQEPPILLIIFSVTYNAR